VGIVRKTAPKVAAKEGQAWTYLLLSCFRVCWRGTSRPTPFSISGHHCPHAARSVGYFRFQESRCTSMWNNMPVVKQVIEPESM
jgi:hypothetical protein